MTVKQLAAALAELDQAAVVDVRVDGQPDGDWRVEGWAPQVIDKGPNQGSWLTLFLEDAR